jgi:hypothetical protein
MNRIIFSAPKKNLHLTEMSLLIYIYRKQEGTDMTALQAKIPSPHNELFGFDRCRETLWGHPITKSLGCELIGTLKDQNIYAFGENVFKLKKEFNIILDNIEWVEKETNYDHEFSRFRVQNALEVIKVVEQHLDITGVAIE